MHGNLWTLIQPSLDRYADNPAWICRTREGRRVVTYEELRLASLSTAAQLRSHGIKPGDTVAITAPNGPEWTVSALASWKIGANIAPIHIGNSPADIASQVNAIKPAVMLVHGAESAMSNYLEISLDSDPKAVAQELAIAAPEDPHQIAVRIYTSGSTGTPKVVRLSHANHASNMVAACNIKAFGPHDRFISLLPLSHAMGLTANVLLPLYTGAGIVTPKVLAAGEILQTLEEEQISVLIAVPRLFRNIMNGLEKKFQSASPVLRAYVALIRLVPQSLKPILNAPIRKKLGGRITCWVSGGSRLDGKICLYFHELGLPLRQGYGLTETSPLASVQEEFDSAVESVGRAVEKVEIRINEADAEGNGEVWIRGPNVMLGYENDEQNAQAFEGDWFKTGDIGTMDGQGRITLTGRSKRLIVTEAGKNVYPEELETLLERDPRIKEAGVFELDMKPVCVVSTDMANGDQVVKDVLKEFNKTVSSHNQITRFAVVDELPRTPLGKLALQQLPELFNQHESS